MKRAYKLQEFVAHSSHVNCLKIGKKTSRVLATGGEDHKVNIWAIGKPNALLSLSGHSSAVESVTFDSSEVLVVAGASNGTIKLWDLEEAKLVRTSTGHRSNCVCVDFHPFGEFFASGSLDTNLKIWDIRRKSCIHTYKGHTRGVNAIKFSPDGRWVVSGGEDNIVKLWDLTAGKLMHDFKAHDGQIQCVDFHPQEFLLATGSADRTVRFWDLETFEVIGTAGPETTGVRSMIFNPDGRTLLAGLHENLKVFSWEPLRCHDAVDVGWSKLADVNVHEGKLLGCSYNQSCVGVWVVDISRVGPYSSGNLSRANGTNEVKLASGQNQSSQQVDNNLKSNFMRLSLSHTSEQGIKEQKLASIPTSENVPGTPQRAGMSHSLKNLPASSGGPSYVVTPKKNSTSRVQPTTNSQTIGRPVEVVPVIVPRTSTSRSETMSDSKREAISASRTNPSVGMTRSSDMTISAGSKDDSEKSELIVPSSVPSQKHIIGNGRNDQKLSQTDRPFASRFDSHPTNSLIGDEGSHFNVSWAIPNKVKRNSPPKSNLDTSDRNASLMWPPSEGNAGSHSDHLATSRDLTKRVVEPGHARALVESWEKREKPTVESPSMTGNRVLTSSGVNPSLYMPQITMLGQRRTHVTVENDNPITDENFALEDLFEEHNAVMSVLQTRLTKLQVIRNFWQRNDLRGAIDTMSKMGDHSVSSDFLSILNERSDIFTLDICTMTLPLITRTLESEVERHLSVAMDVLAMLLKMFGDVIRTTIAAPPTIGVDVVAEERIGRCKLCHTELQKIKELLQPLTRKVGAVSKSAQSLISTLQNG
eukprot:TRINITY_DN10952_c0_g1_i1.p1 TRINITY_DN10952_c0_g1~~TRINITY_DN10952_c0_g1_i1.p1  ORF type:complete len:814 (+),score=152.69 TRINITY_DN10952_c0_g1_i1:424-2865(+)